MNTFIFAAVDLSPPRSALLRAPYLFYLGRIVPLAGMIFGANPYLYGILARFMERSSANQWIEYELRQRDCQLYRYRLSGGCATALVGMKVSAFAA